MVADLYQTAGASRVITIDLHAAQIQGFFNVPIDDLTAIPMMGQYFKTKHLEDVVVVSPDHGGTTRARKLAEILDAPLAIVDKRRPKPNVCEAMNVIGDVKDKNAILVDDIIDTGGTIIAGAKALKERGAKEVLICCSHALFNNNALEKFEKADFIKEVICTDTIEHPEFADSNKVTVISIAEMIADCIRSHESHEKIKDLYARFH